MRRSSMVQLILRKMYGVEGFDAQAASDLLRALEIAGMQPPATVLPQSRKVIRAWEPEPETLAAAGLSCEPDILAATDLNYNEE